MARDDIAAELARLAEAVRPAPPAWTEGVADGAEEIAATAAGEGSATARLEDLVAELRAVLGQPAEDIEQAIASHPWGATAAAFVLGVAVGRMLPRG